MEYDEPSRSTDSSGGGYGAIVEAATSVVMCAHADPALRKLAARCLTVEFRRWFEVQEGDDE